MKNNNVVECVGKADRSHFELENLIQDIHNCDLLSGDSSLVSKYEDALSGYFGVPHAIAVSSGTAALHASLAKVIQPGDEVLIPVIGVSMTASAILLAGDVPVFYDCQPDSFKPDLASLEKFSSEKTRVLITVSMWGYPAIDNEIVAFARTKNWIIMEDAAQSFGTRHGGKFEGTIGHIGCFSTQEFKLISTGEGGFILTDDPHFAKVIREFTRLGFSQEHKTFGFQSGLNYRLSALQASLGLSQLSIAKEKIVLRNKKVNLWKDALGLSDSGTRLRAFNSEETFEHNGYALGVRIIDAGENFAKPLLVKLFEAGVGTDIHRYKQSLIVNFPFLKDFYAQPKYTLNQRIDFPNASKIMDGLITLPCHDQVSFDGIEVAAKKVVDCVGSAELQEP